MSNKTKVEPSLLELSKDFKKLKNNKNESDLTINIDTKTYYGHKTFFKQWFFTFI